ncbi:MAG: PAS domain S-box protein [Candidatus Dadabacteria bacterium]|nr:MAG: PAS domain S-box protein [Candidatus Dadabacteria bacterium]
MARREIKLIDEEREFDITELFFSITDKKGIIEFGNDVFTRISAYSEVELINKPHNIIRHPDMPRAVFQLLWDYIQSGRLIAAYVKNLAKDGRYYWVMATVMPCEGGYVSIRLKPTTDYFNVVQVVYKEVLAVEQEIETGGGRRRDAIKAGIEATLKILAENGFPDYDSFMQTAFLAEMFARQKLCEQASQPADGGLRVITSDTDLSNRDPVVLDLFTVSTQLNRELQQLFISMDELNTLNSSLQGKASFVEELQKIIRLLAMNASVKACRLGDQGAPLRVVADVMSRKTNENKAVMANLEQDVHHLEKYLKQLIFDIAVCKLQLEIVERFTIELLTAHDKIGAEGYVENREELLKKSSVILATLLDKKLSFCLGSLSELLEKLQSTSRLIEQLGCFTRELSLIHFTGKVEIAVIEEAASFSATFAEILRQIERTETELKEFMDLIESSSSCVRNVNNHSSVIAERCKTLCQTASDWH